MDKPECLHISLWWKKKLFLAHSVLCLKELPGRQTISYSYCASRHSAFYHKVKLLVKIQNLIVMYICTWLLRSKSIFNLDKVCTCTLVLTFKDLQDFDAHGINSITTVSLSSDTAD